MEKHLLGKLRLSGRMLLMLLLGIALTTPSIAQNKKDADLNIKLSMTLDNSSVQSIINAIAKKSDIKFVYDPVDLQTLPRISGDYQNVTLKTILDKCFEGTRVRYKVIGPSIIIEQITKLERLTLYGVITDRNKVPLPGATVFLKGTNVGASADGMGRYRIAFGKTKNSTLVFSFIGHKTIELSIDKSGEHNIMLFEDQQQIEDVVVNGMYTRERSTFTGAVTTITADQITAISNTNLIGAIAALTPGMSLVSNNTQGSNPNSVPQLLIRGANSIMTSAEEKAFNNPLIILDGMEISMEELYDLDIYEVERVDVLKDATATIAYGDRAANGVIVVERKRDTESKVRLSYNFVPDFSIPDLSSMNLCNASQKLELERLAGLYDSPDGKYDMAYARKLQSVRSGVNTNWIEAPLRTSFSHSHSVQLSGRGNNVEYRASLRFADKYGIMRGDNRRNYDMGFSINYHLPNKITIGYTARYALTDTKNSPYGNFSDYARLNPYDPVYDANGDFIKTYYFYDDASLGLDRLFNPLYNATLSSFNTSSNQSLRNSLNARWDITKLFYITGQFNVNINKSRGDNFQSPDHASAQSLTNPLDKGEYRLRTGEGFDYDGKLVVNYKRNFKSEGSGFAISAGADMQHNKSNSANIIAKGFLKDKLNDIKYAAGYKGQPSGEERITARVGFLASANVYFKNRYFADVSFRTSGSSTYGANNRFAPIWAVGAGWNIHKEAFMKNVEWMNVLRFRVSTGYTGQVAFSPYQAMTTYKYNTNLGYLSGIGANPITMGDPDLKWQRTFKTNFGINSTLFKERLNVSFDYFVNKTTDMLMDIPVPASVGIPSIKVNFGEMKNSGFDISFSGQVIKTKDFTWTMAINGSHVFDKLQKISPSLKDKEHNLNEDIKDKYGSNLRVRFREGGSQYDIYAVRSAGIDPATGQEIFIKLNGEYTYKYNADDEVVVGNSNPTLAGAWLHTFRYKGFQLSLTFQYSFGGDMYNETLWRKVENIDPRINVDARAFTDRWKNPGDLQRFMALDKKADDYNSERFIERFNELYLSNVTFSYDFSANLLKRIGIKRLMVGFGLQDVARFSTVKYERGTEYPYARSFNITLRPTF